MTSKVKEQISNAVKDAMRAKDKPRLGLLRILMSEFKRIEVDERIELDDARVLAVLDKQLKQRKDSAHQFAEAGRQDLADQENFEISVIQEFLPTALSADEIANIIQAAIVSADAKSMGDMGKVMAVVKPQIQGRADMAKVSKLVKDQLN